MARVDWDTYFLGIAAMVSKRSTCLRRHYGAVIVDADHKIVSTGYNGNAIGQDNCCDLGYCIRQEANIPHGQNYELCRAIHGEMNAIINADPEKRKGATLYIYGCDSEGNTIDSAPCLMCQRFIANAKIRKVVYASENAPVTYFVNPLDKEYYRVEINGDRGHFRRFLSIQATDERQAKELTMEKLRQSLPAITEVIQNQRKEEGRDTSEDIAIDIKSVKNISYREWLELPSWLLPKEK